jgi:hypothetical protein
MAEERSAAGVARRWWMTALAVACFAALPVHVVRDLFVGTTGDVEIWLGFEVYGTAARVTAPVHWTLFAVAGWAYWTARRWIVPWTVAYLVYVAVSHVVWSEASPNGRGWPIGVAQAIAISLLALALHRAGRTLPASGRARPPERRYRAGAATP